GDAFLCRSEFVQGIEREGLIANFNEDRADRYKLISKQLRDVQKILSAKSLSENELMAVEHSTGKLERQLEELKEIDFFECPGQKSTANLLKSIVAKVDHIRGSAEHRIVKCNPNE